VVQRLFFGLLVSRQIGLLGARDSRGPSLHGLSHRLAINTLLEWHRRGIEAEPHLPVLSSHFRRYLGAIRRRRAVDAVTVPLRLSPSPVAARQGGNSLARQKAEDDSNTEIGI
jgi:hypothetical protein